MPALTVCGQKTFMAGDDLLLPSVLFLAFRLLQLAVLIPMSFFMAREQRLDFVGCPETRPNIVENGLSIAIAYVVVSYLLVVIGILLDIGICRASGKGTPTQPEKRKQVQWLCQWKLIPLSVLRVAAITLGVLCITVIGDFCSCQDPEDTYRVKENECAHQLAWDVYFRILVATHIVEAAIVAVTVVYFALKCAPKTPSLVTAETKWQCCCRCFIGISTLVTCCCFGGARQIGDFRDIAMVLSDYFDNGGTLDIVTSDIIVGLLMLLRVQEQRRLECRDELLRKAKEHEKENAMEKGEANEAMEDLEEEKSDGDSDSDSIDPELARLALMEQTAEHPSLRRNALIVYQMDRSGDTVHFVPVSRDILTPRHPKDKVAIAEGAHFVRYARAMYTYKMDFFENPFKFSFVFASSALRSLFRKRNPNVEGDNWWGGHEASLEVWAGLEKKQVRYANFSEGIGKVPYCVAVDREWRCVVLAIRGTQALEDIVTDVTLRPQSMAECGERCGFDGSDCYAHAGMLESSEWIYDDLEKNGVLEKLLKEEASAGYDLVLTGHSLGAGCAAVLSVLLRSKYPSLRCLAFSPPGCTLSENLAESCKEYCTSYVLDSDIVPRLSLESMEHLRDGVLEMIARIKVPKRQAAFTRGNCTADVNRELLHRRESIPDTKFSEQLAEFRAYNAKKKCERSILDVKLYPPGNIIHLVKTGEKTTCLPCGEGHDAPFTARWGEANDFAEVIISPHLLDDHRPLNVLMEVERLAEAFGLSEPFKIGNNVDAQTSG